MGLRKCQGRCGLSFDDEGFDAPALPDTEVALFLCLGCSLSYAVWCKENGHEDAIPTPLVGVVRGKKDGGQA